MNIIVCVKRVPDTAGTELQIAQNGRTISETGLVFDINEWDKYAVEEAVRLKEKYGGTVTAITLGPESADDILRRCFVTGCDAGIRLTDEAFTGSDAVATARVLHRLIRDTKFDLILTGVQASDDGYGQAGPVLAEMLGIPHAVLVTGIEISDGKARVERELEGGTHEVVEIKLPAVLTIQTGINEPRYVSIRALMRVAAREIKVINLNQIGLKAEEVGEAGSRTHIERLFLPPVTRAAEILSAEPDEATVKMIQILKDKGISL